MPDISPVIVETTIKAIKLISPFLERIGITKITEFLKGGKNKSAYIKTAEDAKAFLEYMDQMEKIIEKIKNNPSLTKIREVKKFLDEHWDTNSNFLNNHAVLLIDGKYTIISRDNLNDIINKVKEERTKDSEQKINIVYSKDADTFNEYKNQEKIAEKPIAEIVKSLDSNYKSLVALSIYVESLYKDGHIEKANDIKQKICRRYDRFGLKFCNLYIRGYIKGLFISMYKDLKEGINIDIDKEIVTFVNHRAKNIFFIYSKMDEETVGDITSTVAEALNKGSEYVAVHSLESSRPLAKKIEESLIAFRINENMYSVKIIDEKKEGWVKEYSKIWYRGDGKEIFALIPA